MGEEKHRQDKYCLFPELSYWADSFRQKSPIASTSLLCSGSGLKEWVVITAEAKSEKGRVEEKMHK